jgi:hypothetical protein
VLPKLPFNFVQGPKHAPVIGGRYVLLLGAQRRLTVRRGVEHAGYMEAVHRSPLANSIDYYGDDAIFFDVINQVRNTFLTVVQLLSARWLVRSTDV